MRIVGTDLHMIRGDTEAIKVSCINERGETITLGSGDTIYFTVKKSTDTETKLLQKIVTTFSEGTALINIMPEDTKPFKPGVYYYDIQLNRSNGQVKTIIPPSKFVVEPEVTYE